MVKRGAATLSYNIAQAKHIRNPLLFWLYYRHNPRRTSSVMSTEIHLFSGVVTAAVIANTLIASCTRVLNFFNQAALRISNPYQDCTILDRSQIRQLKSIAVMDVAALQWTSRSSPVGKTLSTMELFGLSPLNMQPAYNRLGHRLRAEGLPGRVDVHPGMSSCIYLP